MTATDPRLLLAGEDPADAGPAEAKATVTLVLVAAAGLMVSLSLSLLIPVLPRLAVELHTSATSAEWLLTATLLTGAIAVPVLGRLGDLYGKKRMLVVSLVAFLAGSLICACTSDIGVLIAGRAVAGLSVAAIPLGISLVGTVLPDRRAGSGIALISAMLGVGSALGLPLAGVIAEHADYHVLFWICVAGGAATLAGTVALVPEPPVSGHGKFDLPGALLLAVALAALLLPLSQASTWGWGNARTLGLLAASVVLLAVFVYVERRLGSPLVDMTVNARPSLLLTNIASLAVGFALFAVLIGTANFVEAPAAAGYGFGSSILTGGLCLLPSGLFMLILSPVSAKISALAGPKVALALGAAVVAAGFLLRIFLVAHLWEVVAGTAVTGARHRRRLRGHAEPDLAVRAAGRAGRRQRAELPRPHGGVLARQRARRHRTDLADDHAGGVCVPVARRLPDAVRDLRRHRSRRGGDRPGHPDVVRPGADSTRRSPASPRNCGPRGDG